MTFAKDIKKFENKTAKNYLKIQRGSAFTLFSAIVVGTPVDKGTLRGNWFANISNPNLSVSDNTDESGQPTIDKIQSVLAKSEATKDIFLNNNLPYAARIEFDGHSRKAQAGMVRVNTARWNKIVRANVRKFANAS